MSSHPARLPLIDAAKALACIAIIGHHLAFYGPMSDVVHKTTPGAIEWLYEYGRMAVQVFLVMGGFLAAATLAPDGVARVSHAGSQILRRYVRLAGPYAVAIALSVVVSALVRLWADHPSIPNEPGLTQLLAHAVFLQDVLGYDALSAGAWYVAIDFQLFAMALGLVLAAQWLQARWPISVFRGIKSKSQSGTASAFQPVAQGATSLLGWSSALVFVATAASLLYFNRQPQMDVFGSYFFGAYGLGALAYWSTRSPHKRGWWLVLVLLTAAALWVEFRLRIAVAAVTAALMVLASAKGAALQVWLSRSWLRWLDGLGRMSYSVFLVHFPVCLLVNMVVGHFWPEGYLANAAGMVAAVMLSLAAGRLMFVGIEAPRATFRPPLRVQAGAVMLVCVALAWARGWA